MIDPSQIDWPVLGPVGDALLHATAIRTYNDIADTYGAPRLPLPDESERRVVTKYKMRSVRDVLSGDPIRWLIKGVLPEKGLAALYGASGSGKSFLALDMALRIAKGEDWFGYRTKKRPVVYLYLEGEAGLSVRLLAAKQSVGAGIAFVSQPFNLLNKENLRDLIESIRATSLSGGVVIIDTFNQSARIDENNSSEMGNAIAAAKIISQLTEGLVLLVHHVGKDATKGPRGHSSFFAALDAAIEVRRSGEDREWSVAKAKDGSDGKGHPFVLDRVDLFEDEDGDRVSSCSVRPVDRGTSERALSGAQQLGMDTFMTAASQNISGDDQKVHARLDQWRDEFHRRSTAETAGGKRSLFSRVRNELVDLGRLTVVDDVYYLHNAFAKTTSDKRVSESKASLDSLTRLGSE